MAHFAIQVRLLVAYASGGKYGGLHAFCFSDLTLSGLELLRVVGLVVKSGYCGVVGGNGTRAGQYTPIE